MIIGTKLNETKREVKILNVDLIIVDDELSPNQQKYLEDFFKIYSFYLKLLTKSQSGFPCWS